MIRKTKIVCTLGPSSDSDEMVSKLMDAGMNVCRLNMSHGSYEEQGERIARIKRLRAEKDIPVAILLDTKGPEVRTKTLAAGKVTLEPARSSCSPAARWRATSMRCPSPIRRWLSWSSPATASSSMTVCWR